MVHSLKKGSVMQNKKTTFVALIAVLLTIGALWFTNRAVTPKQATWVDVLAEGKNGRYQIITTDDLAKRYQKDSSSLVLIDKVNPRFGSKQLPSMISFVVDLLIYYDLQSQLQRAVNNR